ncbi:MAG TPA: MBL fold metallo-hydrolase [Chitinophagaceae bacterium]|nr:MBL fold metallo-hydrolase [Chitinophagaceae bacterium]
MSRSASKRQERIRQSGNFKNGSFQNLSNTPMKPPDVSWFSIIKDSLNRPKEVRPSSPLPSVKTDLNTLHSDSPVIVWFGHSSYLLRCRDFTILVDPVFSGHASPFSFAVKAFAGADVYKPADMPAIDALILTHNHYDHLDTGAIAQLKDKIAGYYAPLGVGQLLEGRYSGGRPVTELDWWETAELAPGIRITATPARHFSGRGLKRGGTLWTSYVLNIYGYKIFLGGDSGYDTHFKQIGDTYGPFDMALLECGQYNESWPYIHMMPEQTVQAAMDLKAKVLFPVHWAKFTLANHAWNEPIKRVTARAKELNVPIVTPMIGEPVVIDNYRPVKPWWG